ncbi:MAG: carboxyl transferase domain-containing protein [Acidimicrobiales bacterium]
MLPESANGSYDCRDIVATIVDDGDLLELHPDWAANLVTGLARLGVAPSGSSPTSPRPWPARSTSPPPARVRASSHSAMPSTCRCSRSSTPPGFYPGKDLEWRGMIRYGAQMAFAYARATVPRVNLTTLQVLRRRYIVMDSKRMGNDMALAWPSAEIAVMGAKGAVEILHRGVDADARAELEAGYEERLLNPYIAADRGTIDAVIDPADTRRQIHAAFTMLAGKRERLPATPRQHAAVSPPSKV